LRVFREPQKDEQPPFPNGFPNGGSKNTGLRALKLQLMDTVRSATSVKNIGAPFETLFYQGAVLDLVRHTLEALGRY
jgi:hypothetical protein